MLVYSIDLNAQKLFLSADKFYMHDLQEGQFIGAKYGAILRESPESGSEALDTLFDNYQLLYFTVLDGNPSNGFVNVKMIISKPVRYNFETGIAVFPKLIDDGLEGWIYYEDIDWFPVPESFYLSTYFESEQMIEAIISNATWQSVNKKKDYEWVRSRHAKCNLIMSIINYERDSLKKAIYYSTKSIQILPKNTAFKIRILSKLRLNDFVGAVSDCNSGIASSSIKRKQNISGNEYLDEGFEQFDGYKYLYLRGWANLALKNFPSAIIDFDNVIKSQNENYLAYYYRGIAKFNSGRKNEACLDFSKAGDLGFDKAFEAISEYCNVE